MKTWNLYHQPLPKYSALSYAWHHEETPAGPHVGMNSMIDIGRENQDDLDWKARVSPEVEKIVDGRGEHMPAFWRAPNVVRCNGKFLPVSRTLYFALIRLRSLRRETKYWIDAICINQQDAEEKRSQIIIMGDIFSQAEKVMVWLGRARFPCRRFVEYLWQLPEMHKDHHFAPKSRSKAAHSFSKDHFEQARSYGANPSAPTGLEAGGYIYPLSEREHYRLKMYEEQREHLTMYIWRPPNFRTHAINNIGDEFVHFFDEQWFHRTWTLQEMVLAQDLEFLWGPAKLSEDEMLRCVLWYNTRIVTRDVGSPTDMIYAFDARSEYQRFGPLGLLRALTLSRHRNCMRAEDKLFAVLGMAGQAAGLDIGNLARRESDTTDEMYVDSVYKKLATYLAPKVGAELLTLVGSRQAASLPSWVPDLRVDLWPTSIWQSYRERFQAIMPDNYELHALQVDGDLLRINGAQIDTVSQALGGLSENGGSFEFAWIIRNVIDRRMPHVRYSRTSEPILRALWRTILLGSSDLEQMGTGFITWFLGQYKRWASTSDGPA